MRALFCFIAIAMISSATAHADDREEARREFAAGQASDKLKDWDGAIEHYLRAYELVPHHFALYNIATDYERLGKIREAATWYIRYVDTAPDSADRDKVQRLLAELKLRPAKLTVRSTPVGAKVTIDGNPHGVTPFTGSLRGGGHRVVVENAGSREERDVTIEYGEPLDVLLTLRPAPVVRAPGELIGVLDIHGTPAGARVTIDDVPSGVVPVRLDVAPGTHTVRISQYGYTPYDTTVEVYANQDTAVEAKLVQGGLGSYAGTPKIQVSYILGGAVGADLRGTGEMILGELGVRVANYDASARVGRAASSTAVDLVIRWAITKTRLAPFVGIGYTFLNSGGGYELVGGLRLDVLQGDKVGITLLAESGFRYHAIASTGTTPDTEGGLLVPFLASVQLLYR
jgi:hypothetical protein